MEPSLVPRTSAAQSPLTAQKAEPQLACATGASAANKVTAASCRMTERMVILLEAKAGAAACRRGGEGEERFRRRAGGRVRRVARGRGASGGGRGLAAAGWPAAGAAPPARWRPEAAPPVARRPGSAPGDRTMAAALP